MSSPCPLLHTKLSLLRSHKEELEELQRKLLTEGSSAVKEIQEALILRRKEIASLKQEIEALLKEATQEMKDTPESIKKLLLDIGSPATLDESFEGGIIHLELDAAILEKLTTWDKAKEAYTQADNGSSSYINPNFNDSHFTSVTSPSLSILVLNHGVTQPQERDKLVDDMDKAGYRPLTLSELMALGIIKPELNKRNEVLNTYKKYSLVGGLHAPYLYWSGGERDLNAFDVSSEWFDRDRFLFVRK